MQDNFFKNYEKILSDFKLQKEIYKPSKFWEKLNELNLEWIRIDGINTFKRSVNNNYFNWMVSFKSDYFQEILKSYYRRNKKNIFSLIKLFFLKIDNFEHRTYTSSITRLSFLNRRLYAIYLYCLANYVEAQDSKGLFVTLEEPSFGSPVILKHGHRIISQDICNSYLEYLYISDSLSESFEKVKVIAEIGGGYGRLAYVFQKIEKSVKYILIDLPPALTIAQSYLEETLPNKKILQYQRYDSFVNFVKDFEDADVCFLLPEQLEFLPKNYIDLIINISSFQEMTIPQINHYYDLVNEKAKFFYTKQWLLWKNPDDDILVPAIIYPTKPNWKLVSARINPVHQNFFEAIFGIENGI